MTSPYCAVTVVDTASSVGLADATAWLLDYRFSDPNYIVSFIGTLSSVGTGDGVKVYVSPDATKDKAGSFAEVGAFTSTTFANVVTGVWGAVKFTKSGTQTGKVVAMLCGHNPRNDQV